MLLLRRTLDMARLVGFWLPVLAQQPNRNNWAHICASQPMRICQDIVLLIAHGYDYIYLSPECTLLLAH